MDDRRLRLAASLLHQRMPADPDESIQVFVALGELLGLQLKYTPPPGRAPGQKIGATGPRLKPQKKDDCPVI